mmetsp:Transcript_36070/g.91144  ORF Transcript_36070/g.91144 Transcript_36070/m.91144 type:complete len:281 (+) Transcript_36070:551-1393(+)
MRRCCPTRWSGWAAAAHLLSSSHSRPYPGTPNPSTAAIGPSSSPLHHTTQRPVTGCCCRASRGPKHPAPLWPPALAAAARLAWQAVGRATNSSKRADQAARVQQQQQQQQQQTVRQKWMPGEMLVSASSAAWQGHPSREQMQWTARPWRRYASCTGGCTRTTTASPSSPAARRRRALTRPLTSHWPAMARCAPPLTGPMQARPTRAAHGSLATLPFTYGRNPTTGWRLCSNQRGGSRSKTWASFWWATSATSFRTLRGYGMLTPAGNSPTQHTTSCEGAG